MNSQPGIPASPGGTARPRTPMPRRGTAALGAVVVLVAALAAIAVLVAARGGDGGEQAAAPATASTGATSAPSASAPAAPSPSASGPSASDASGSPAGGAGTPTVRTVSAAPSGRRGSGALPVNVYRSLRVTTPGFTDRYLRHGDDHLGGTEVVTADSPERLRQQSTWKIVPGLASARCYSFESLDAPGQFLRHQNYRVRADADTGDRSLLFTSDATWCPEPAPGGGVRFRAFAFPGKYLRHFEAQLWLSSPANGRAWDAPASFGPDTTWTIEPALGR